MNISDKELLEKLTRQYDGFCFERTASKHVFAPWLLLNFFSYPENGLVDYWFESGGKPSVLVEYLKSHALRHPKNIVGRRQFLFRNCLVQPISKLFQIWDC